MSEKQGPHTTSPVVMILVDKVGNKQYCKFGRNLSHPILHRTDGPAIEYINGYKAWYKDGRKHGVVEFGGKVCSTWKNGVRIDEEQP